MWAVDKVRRVCVFGAPCRAWRGVCRVGCVALCGSVRRSKRVGACGWLCGAVCGVARSVRGSVRVWQCLAVIGRECVPCVRSVRVRVSVCGSVVRSCRACGSVSCVFV